MFSLGIEDRPEADGLRAARDEQHRLVVGVGLDLIGHFGGHRVKGTQEALAAGIGDEVRKLALQLLQELKQVGAHLARVLDEVVLLDDLHKVPRPFFVFPRKMSDIRQKIKQA